ncbi:MAG: MFS transporter [Lachnospiraceae bacterium]|nr:MFS transporter [Candidatus Colinaster scatohippi]
MKEKFREIFKEDSCYKVFLTSLLVTGLGYGIYKGVIDNYMAEIVGMGEFDRGLAEFFREIPGLMLIFILAALYMLSAQKLYKLGAVIMLVGMGMLSVVTPTKLLVTVAVCIYSLGEHIQLGMKNTLSLEFAKEKQGGQALGYQNALYQAGTVVGYVIIIIIFAIMAANKLYKPVFLAATLIMAIGAVFSFKVDGNIETDKSKSRFYFRKKYSKYYMLEVFYGARKQVFFTFGPYVLILFYGANAAIISLLFAISAVCCFFLAPLVGKLIDRIGYKIVMISDTLILVIVCFFYGFAHHIFPREIAFIVCCVNYILDSVISLASMASNVYVQDISDSQEEVKATISTGISVNHLITVLIALFGGLVWQTLGIETLFIISAVLGLCNSAYAATIKTGNQG